MTHPVPPKTELERKYHVENKTCQVICDEYGVSISTVRNWFKKLGIALRDESECHTLPVPQRQELIELYGEQYMTAREIGEKYGVCTATVLKWLRERDIAVRDRGGYRCLIRPPREELVELHDVQHFTVKKIAEVYGCCGTTAFGWLAQYGISGRNERPNHRKTETCAILKKHADDLMDDPERLSTEFMQKLIGVRC